MSVDTSKGLKFQALKQPEAQTMRSEFEAYTMGKNDTLKALSAGQPIKCGLSDQEKKEKKLVSHWLKGSKHCLSQVAASMPQVSVEARQLARELAA